MSACTCPPVVVAGALAPPGAAPQATVDLTKDGGDVFWLVAAEAQLAPGATLLVECPAGGGDCIADAVLVESAARYNDGAAVAQVTLQPMDAIVLRRTAGCTAEGAAAASAALL